MRTFASAPFALVSVALAARTVLSVRNLAVDARGETLAANAVEPASLLDASWGPRRVLTGMLAASGPHRHRTASTGPAPERHAALHALPVDVPYQPPPAAHTAAVEQQRAAERATLDVYRDRVERMREDNARLLRLSQLPDLMLAEESLAAPLVDAEPAESPAPAIDEAQALSGLGEQAQLLVAAEEELPQAASVSAAPVAKVRKANGCNEGELLFGTWNIQSLGITKEQRPAMMNAIRRVISRYDIVVIQDVTQAPAPPYKCGPLAGTAICAANPDPEKFALAMSPRSGDHQFAIFVRKSVGELSKDSAAYPNLDKRYDRPPHKFEVRGKTGDRKWMLEIGVVHNSRRRGRTAAQIGDFPNVLSWMRAGSGPDASYILAGDFEADGFSFDERVWTNSELGPAFRGYTLMTGNELETTAWPYSDTLDRIIVDQALAQRSGKARVFSVETLDLKKVKEEGCKLLYMDDNLCGAEVDDELRIPWARWKMYFKNVVAGKISDHRPVEMCIEP